MKKKIEWTTLLIGLFWSGYTIYALIKYLNGTLDSLRVPRIVSLIYEFFGFIPGIIIQLIFGLILVFISFKSVEDYSGESTEDKDEI